MLDLRLRGKIGRLGMCGVQGPKLPAVRAHMASALGGFVGIEPGCIETWPADDVVDPTAFQQALASFSAGDIAIIFTPDDTHAAIAAAAIGRGMHVLITKPPTQHLHQHRTLAALAKKARVLAAVEVHKRYDPIYIDARDRIAAGHLGPFSFFSSYMSQPKVQLETFRGWAGKASDISYYLNAHHIDFHAWCLGASARPETVTALFSDGVANRLLSSRPCHVDTQDTITLAVQWRNRNGSAKLTNTYLGPDKTILGSAGVGMQAGVAGGGGVPHRGEVDEEAFHGEGASPASKRKRAAPTPPASTALPRAQQPTGSLHSPGGSVHTPDAADGFEGGSVHTLDAVHGFEGGSVGHATYTSSWIAPRSDVHSQQRWFYMGQAGELSVDQAHRGYSSATDASGFQSINPLFWKPTPDASTGRFAGQQCYGYRSFQVFVEACAACNSGEKWPGDFRDSLPTLQATMVTTAILEAGRRSLDSRGATMHLLYDDDFSAEPTQIVPGLVAGHARPSSEK